MLVTRISAPGLFSTSTLSVCFTVPAFATELLRNSVACLPRSCRHLRLSLGILHDVEGGGAGRDHREAVLARVDAGVDDARPARRERLAQRGVQLLLVL